MQSEQSHRKDEHLFLAEKYYQPESAAGFDQVRLLHQALPESAVHQSSVTPNLLGWRWPFFINAMTGGSANTGRYNQQLAELAAQFDLAIASGSQSVALKDPNLAPTFTVMRKVNPDGFIIGNLGAGNKWEQAQAAIAMLDANALEMHLNVTQELVMPEGDRDYHWADDLATIIAKSPVPVIIKEVGFGMTHEAITLLQSLGAKYIDVGGHGGTNFAQIENTRRSARDYAYLVDHGQSTVESLLEAQGASATILATGGVRTPLDVIKALRLGASAVGIAGQMLHWLIQEGQEEAANHLRTWQDHLPGLMAMVGAANLEQLTQVPVVLEPRLDSYRQQRHLLLP